MKRFFTILAILAIGCLLTTPKVFAQYDVNPKPFSLQNDRSQQKRPKIQFGGNFGLQLGTYTAINISPQVGIYPTDWLLMGGGISYMFVSQYKYSRSHLAGANLFIQPFIAKRVIIHAEYEYSRIFTSFLDGDRQQFENHGVAAGVGYRHYLNDKISIYGLLLINLYQSYWINNYIPYFRVGVNVDI